MIVGVPGEIQTEHITNKSLERNRYNILLGDDDDDKSKAVPVTGHGGPEGCERSRLSHLLDSRSFASLFQATALLEKFYPLRYNAV
jgi:hypothetical protein